MIAGRDLLSGGTWAGVSEEGRFAVVTNRTGYGPPDPERASRGALVENLLSGEGSYARPRPEDLDAFNPFNLFSIEDGRAVFRSNRPEPIERELTPGVHGLTNGPIEEPWPRSLALTRTLEVWLEGAADQPEALFEAMLDSRDQPVTWPAEGQAPRPDQHPVFIRNPAYGTRCSTLVTIAEDGAGTISERRFDADGERVGDTRIAFRWPE